MVYTGIPLFFLQVCLTGSTVYHYGCLYWYTVYIGERQTAILKLMLLYVNSAVPLSDLQEAPQTCQHICSATAIPYCCLVQQWGTNGCLTNLSASVSIPVFDTGMDIKYRCMCLCGFVLVHSSSLNVVQK